MEVNHTAIDSGQVYADDHALCAAVGVNGWLPRIRAAKPGKLDPGQFVNDVPKTPLQASEVDTANIAHHVLALLVKTTVAPQPTNCAT
jgi:hypothetical protein